MLSSVASASWNSTRAQRRPICLRKRSSSSLMPGVTRWASLMFRSSYSSIPAWRGAACGCFSGSVRPR